MILRQSPLIFHHDGSWVRPFSLFYRLNSLVFLLSAFDLLNFFFYY